MRETATYTCDNTGGCVMQFWPPDDEHMCSKHVEAWNKLIVKQKFCASSWLITEINIPRHTVSKTSKYESRFVTNCPLYRASILWDRQIVHRVTMGVSPPAVEMPLVSSALGRANGEIERTEGILKPAICMLRRARLLCSRRMSGGRKFPPKMLEYLTNTQHTNLKDHHHQFIKTTLEIIGDLSY